MDVSLDSGHVDNYCHMDTTSKRHRCYFRILDISLFLAQFKYSPLPFIVRLLTNSIFPASAFTAIPLLRASEIRPAYRASLFWPLSVCKSLSMKIPHISDSMYDQHILSITTREYCIILPTLLQVVVSFDAYFFLC